MQKLITKSTGEQEAFDIKKFRRSLKRAGASSKIVDQLAQEIERKSELTTTHEIYEYALGRLQEIHRPVAARYNLKAALYELGPSGYPFEEFVGALFREQGYSTRVGEIIKGVCIQHEVDVCLHKDKEHFMVECKFHNRPGIKSDVKVPLYVKARFDDIKAAWEKHEKNTEEYHQAWVVTNTQFTSEARRYAKCVGMKAIGWSYPKDNSLAQMIDRLGLHPITALTTLNKRQKREFIEHGFVLCRDAHKQRPLLEQLGFDNKKIDAVLAEAMGVCELK